MTEGYRYMSGEAISDQTSEEKRADQISDAIGSVVVNIVPHTKAGTAPLPDRFAFEAELVNTLWTTLEHCRDWKLARIGTEEGKILLTNTTGDMKRIPLGNVPKNLKQSFRWAVTDSVEMLARGIDAYEDLARYRNKAIARSKKGTHIDVVPGGERSTFGNALLNAIQPDRRIKEE